MIQIKKQLIECLKEINKYFNWLSKKEEPYQGILKNEDTIPGFKKYEK